MRKLLSLAALVSVLAPFPARAGVALGARLGLALPGGELYPGAKSGDLMGFGVPVQLELDYRFERLAVGVYFRVAPGRLDSSVRSACDAQHASCWATDGGYGLQADTWLLERARGPWIGGHVGFEFFDYGVPGASAKLSGLEAGAQGGFDFARRAATFGPYVGVALGQIRSGKFDVMGTRVADGSLADRSVHTWIQLGIRGAFEL